MNKKQNITILGATGSIGQSTLSVLSQHPDKFSVFALTAYSQVEKLADLCVAFSPKYAVIDGEQNAEKLSSLLKSKACESEVLCGENALPIVDKMINEVHRVLSNDGIFKKEIKKK